MRPIEPGEFTTADLRELPADGMRYELVDGILLVTPAPLPIHQTAAFELGGEGGAGRAHPFSNLISSCFPGKASGRMMSAVRT